MNNLTFYIPEDRPALRYAAGFLSERGCRIVSEPLADVTHLLLGVPAGDSAVDYLALPEHVTVFGGNLDRLLLENHKAMDFLKDPGYLAENAAITAQCAIRLASEKLPVVWTGTPVLVLGWGRIGKCLAKILQGLGVDVTVAARKETDRAMLHALGYRTADTGELTSALPRFRVIFNTVPAPVIPEPQAEVCRPDCLKIDLASTPGIGGDGVIWARGLPGKLAPESSGRLIAETALRMAKEA